MKLFRGSRPSTLGAPGGRLRPCPNRPNCVSSQEERPARRVPPIPFTGSAAEAHERLVEVLKDIEGIELITVREDYIHAEATTPLLGFVDDLELVIDEKESEIHVRSASRVGFSDRGVNRKRVEKLRRLLAANP